MAKKIILTGGAGFIGSCFLSKLNQEGESNIFVVDELGCDLKWKNLVNKKFIDYFEKNDFIGDLASKIKAKDIKAIFHIGACSSTTENNASFLIKNNYEYSKALAKFALDNDIDFYYASSAAVYGNGSFGYSDDDIATLKLRPLNMYGYSKLIFDQWVITNKLTNNFTGFRYFNVYGPNEYHKEDMRSMVVKAYEQIKKDKKIKLFKSYMPEYKDGEQKRDFIYIRDVVNLMYQFYEKNNVKGIFNIGTGIARTWNDLAKAIFKSLNLELNIEYIDMPNILKEKYQYFTQADLTKLKKSGIKYTPTGIEEGVKDYVNYLNTDSFI
ncbi:MAG: ADP-glyceromanno-heptose 6-epimerase [Candidatus Omnitrophota bacterium]